MAHSQRKPQSPESVARNLPPEREKRGLQPVQRPLQTTRLSRLIYILIFSTALLAAYYSYRVVQYKTQVGHWWTLTLGRKPPTQQAPVEHGAPHRHSVEDKINDLAKALGMPSSDLASAIAVAVRNHVPPASLSSVAAQETGPAAQALLKEPSSEHASQTSIAEPSSTGVVEGVVGGFNKFVGMDEP